MHAWDITPKEAVAVQKELRESVRIGPLEATPRLVAGCDISANRFSNEIFGGFVVMSWPTLETVQVVSVHETARFPYIPGLLSFREIPALLDAWERIADKPDLVFVDGAGIAHPRRIGIAAHLGVLLGVPTIGCAKSLLTGLYDEPGTEAGSRTPLWDRKREEIIGTVLRTKRNVKPLFISPGHRVGIEQSADLVLEATRGYRLPEPTRRAHEAMNEARRAYYEDLEK